MFRDKEVVFRRLHRSKLLFILPVYINLNMYTVTGLTSTTNRQIFSYQAAKNCGFFTPVHTEKLISLPTSAPCKLAFFPPVYEFIQIQSNKNWGFSLSSGALADADSLSADTAPAEDFRRTEKILEELLRTYTSIVCHFFSHIESFFFYATDDYDTCL